ncbi:uncharacterized protein [Argopecten irradians]|uniref:uncharacterized protein n=1 Tax=Argopecten irradians TaxID=31199 RepID=UPI0037203493
MADILPLLETLLEKQKQVQEATRTNSVNIANLRGELTSNLGGIKALLHVLNHRIETNLFSPSASRHYEPHRQLHSAPPRSDGGGDISGSEGVHRECLQEHMEYIMKQMTIDGTTLIDELHEDSCLTEGEVSDIRYQRDTKSRIRKLIYAIYLRDKQTFDKFMNRLQSDNAHVHEKIKQAYSVKLNEGPRSSECLMCVIKRDVDIQRVAYKLCSYFIIDMEYLNTVLSFSDVSVPDLRKTFWTHVFSKINQSSSREEMIRQLRNALSEGKYKNLAEKLENWSSEELSCGCEFTSRLHFQKNLNESCSSTSIGDLSTTSNIRSKSQVSLQSLSSLEEEDFSHGGNLPYTVKWVNSSPATGGEGQPWEYPEHQEQMLCSPPLQTEADPECERSDSMGNGKESPFALKSIANALNNEVETEIREMRTPPALANSDEVKTVPADMSTDEQELTKPRHLKLNINEANQIRQQLFEVIVTPSPLPAVDAYTGRKKVYKKKRHTRTKSDDTSKIRLDLDLYKKGEHDRLRLISGLVDTPQRGISEKFYSNLKSIRPRHVESIQNGASGDSTGIGNQSEMRAQSSYDNEIPGTVYVSPESLSQLHKNSETTSQAQHVKGSDGNNNPQYVTDQIILTPSRYINPLSSGLGTRSDQTRTRKKGRQKERYQDGRHRLDTY